MEEWPAVVSGGEPKLLPAERSERVSKQHCGRDQPAYEPEMRSRSATLSTLTAVSISSGVGCSPR